MTPDYYNFVGSVEHHFQNVVNEPFDKFPGAILYTSYLSLKPQKYLFMGLNPSGEPECSMTIKESLYKCLVSEYNEYEEDWTFPKGQNKITKNIKYERGKHPLQLNIKHLCTLLEVDVTQICSSNLIFEPSYGSPELWQRFVKKKVNAKKEIERIYWPVHKLILEYVQPDVIIAFGNDETFSPYWFLREMVMKDNEHPGCVCMPAEHNPYSFKSFNGTINGKKTHVVGLPHLSYYRLFSGAKAQKKNEAFAKFMKSNLDISINLSKL